MDVGMEAARPKGKSFVLLKMFSKCFGKRDTSGTGGNVPRRYGGKMQECFGHSKMTGEEKWVIFTYGLSKENCLQKLFFNKFIEMSCRQETTVFR